MIRAALYGLAFGLVIAGGAAWWALGYGEARNEAKHVAALIQAQADNIAKQKALISGVQKVAEDADKEQLDLERRLAGADQSLERLRQAVRDANARAGSASTAIADAARARSLLATCASQYRDLAASADRLRANVLGLQAYAKAVASE
jgi:uncharacterized membrane protein YccC